MTEVAAITMDTSRAALFAKHLQTAPQIVQEEVYPALHQALQLLEREIKDLTPVGVYGAAGLHGSVTSELRGSPVDGLLGKVFSLMKHALPVEMGTKPHFPPVEAIRDWVEKKLDVPVEESASVAFLVARKISKKGTEGAHMFEEGLSKNTRQILNMIYAAQDRIVARLQAGA